MGDYAVFGSRSVVMAASATKARPVKICDGANVADRCVLLGGATLARSSVLGSGGLAPGHLSTEPGSVWVGSRNGCAVMLKPGNKEAETASIRSPFAKVKLRNHAD